MPLGIDVQNITLHYGKFTALQDVTFQLEGGKIYGLLGRNGAGKTSLLSLIASLQQPTSGTIRIDGEESFENAKIMSQVSFIREMNYDYDSDKPQHLLEFAARYRANFDEDYAAKLVKRFKLPLDKPVSALSRGMQSALGVVMGLASRSPVTIFDEAYLGMDAPAREIFYEEVLDDYMAHPRTIILSTHLISEAASLLEEVVIIDKGQLVLHQDTDSFLEQGVSVTGPAAVVDSFVAGMTQLREQQLGSTKSVMVHGAMSDQQREQARKAGLELGSVGLQELFIHLTSEGEEQ